MKYIYYIDGEKFTTDNINDIPWEELSSPNEKTPAFENLENDHKRWYNIGGIHHRLTGPAVITGDKKEQFWLYDKRYYTVKEWINEHPNPDLYFDAIGVFTETDKVLWFLQN
jgi:hypothetical protein